MNLGSLRLSTRLFLSFGAVVLLANQLAMGASEVAPKGGEVVSQAIKALMTDSVDRVGEATTLVDRSKRIPKTHAPAAPSARASTNGTKDWENFR